MKSLRSVDIDTLTRVHKGCSLIQRLLHLTRTCSVLFHLLDGDSEHFPSLLQRLVTTSTIESSVDHEPSKIWNSDKMLCDNRSRYNTIKCSIDDLISRLSANSTSVSLGTVLKVQAKETLTNGLIALEETLKHGLVNTTLYRALFVEFSQEMEEILKIKLDENWLSKIDQEVVFLTLIIQITLISLIHETTRYIYSYMNYDTNSIYDNTNLI